MHIRIRDPDVAQDPPPVWLAALLALQKNDRQQCQAVKSLTIRGGFAFPEAYRDKRCIDVTSASDPLHDLLYSFIERMHQLSEFR